MRKYSFESLDVWGEARMLVRWIYEVTESYPRSEIFGLASQMKRASISVVSNLAEGSSRKSFRDQAHFSQISYSSLLELLNQLIISFDLNLLNESRLMEGRLKIESLTIKVAGLRNSQMNRISKP